jgi:hypothetical protein
MRARWAAGHGKPGVLLKSQQKAKAAAAAKKKTTPKAKAAPIKEKRFVSIATRRAMAKGQKKRWRDLRRAQEGGRLTLTAGSA